MKTGRVILSTGANHVVDCQDVLYNCIIKGKLRLKAYRSTNPLAVGDYVDFIENEDTTGQIVKIHERTNCIVRKSTNLSKETHIIAANIDQVIIVFTLVKPATTNVFLDRYLVAAELYSIPVLIVFNKIDIYDEQNKQELQDLEKIYSDIGYKTITVSVTEKINMNVLKDILEAKTSLIAGHSGVGKSSLINALIPNLKLTTAAISNTTSLGKHTTTYAQMHKLPFGGFIIDTPGIKGFGIVDIKKEELYHFFKEIFEISANCKYYNCTHIQEPNCAVIQAVNDGIISVSRYKSYLNMFFDSDSKHRQSE